MKAARPPGLLVLAVLAAHLLLSHEVQRIHEGWMHNGPPPMPTRMQVALVREMAPTEPVHVPAAAAPSKDLHAHPAAADAPMRPAALPASAPPPESPASAPVTAASGVEPELPVAAASAAVAASAIVASAASAASAPDGEPGPEWPLSTRLAYDLVGNFRGPVHGQAQVEWLRKGRDYQVNLDVSAGPSFAPLISRRMSSQGQLTPDGIAPQRYDEETRVLIGERRRISVFFLPGEVQLASGVREPVARGAQDSASQFVHLTWLFLTGREALQAGRIVNVPLVLPRKQYLWPYEVVGEETLATPLGALAAWHLRPTREPSGGDLSAEVWLAPALQYLPVQIVIRQDAQTYVRLTLKDAPLQAAPESTDTKPAPRRPAP